jgi:hypothetical protein
VVLPIPRLEVIAAPMAWRPGGVGTGFGKRKTRPHPHREDEEEQGDQAADRDTGHRSEDSRAQVGCRIGPSTGMMNQNALPSPGTDSAPIVPP